MIGFPLWVYAEDSKSSRSLPKSFHDRCSIRQNICLFLLEKELLGTTKETKLQVVGLALIRKSIE